MAPFDFLKAEFSTIADDANDAASAALFKSVVSCFMARRALEQAVNWAYKYDRSLRRPSDATLGRLVNDSQFEQLAGSTVRGFARQVIKYGNQAAHSTKPPGRQEAVLAVSALFEFCYWFARTYAVRSKPPPDLTFDPSQLPRPGGKELAQPAAPQDPKALRHLRKRLEDEEAKVNRARRRNEELAAERGELEDAVARLRAEVDEAKRQVSGMHDDHEYLEAETRDFFIDLLLREAGWPLVADRDLEVEVSGLPTPSGRGFVDYVLWAGDGRPLGLVEAKRTKRDARAGQEQARLYADALERQYGQRPVIFYSNGYEHWIWDDGDYPPRQVQGFYKPDELSWLIQRRRTRQSLAKASVNPDIVDRYYQTRAIRRVTEALEDDKQRKALLVMATGAGKTRTLTGLADLLIKQNWVKRVLFLADRTALVGQATAVFKRFMADQSPVNLLETPNEEGRVYVSTYPTMMNLIDRDISGEVRRFGVGHFDLVVIDEAHRSVFNKYRALFDYFDALLVGLTATPRAEVDRNTYRLFDLRAGEPTDAYDLDEAVRDGYLVPPRAVAIDMEIPTRGLRYDERSEDEKDQWDVLDWGEDEDDIPKEVAPDEINKFLFNERTVDLMLEYLMTQGLKVAGGDRLGKTIVFARNERHAQFIVERFDKLYPRYKGAFARVVTSATAYVDSLIDRFTRADQEPHIAVSVDMLDTGIDIPEVVNLVFAKAVRSKTKFWQMLGRGTRLCPDLFGPGEDKECFYVFDFGQNFQFFSYHPEATDALVPPSLTKRLFTSRLELIASLDGAKGFDVLRADTANLLRVEVAGMDLDSFEIRSHRRLVERFRHAGEWASLSPDDLSTMAGSLAGLPSTNGQSDPEATKRFDLLLLNLQLALLHNEPGWLRLRDQVIQIANVLEGYGSIPGIREQMELIQEIQSDEWWHDATVDMVELVRRNLRLLVPHIERRQRKIVYTDFADRMTAEADIDFQGLAAASELAQFRRRITAFVREGRANGVVEKLRTNRLVTAADLAQLQGALIDAGIGTAEDMQHVADEAGGFGFFIRSLVGLDRNSAKEAFADFLDTAQYNADQIDFVNLIIDHLTEHGAIEARRFYESPFTDLSPLGPESLFEEPDIERLVARVNEVRRNAEAA